MTHPWGHHQLEGAGDRARGGVGRAHCRFDQPHALPARRGRSASTTDGVRTQAVLISRLCGSRRQRGFTWQRARHRERAAVVVLAGRDEQWAWGDERQRGRRVRPAAVRGKPRHEVLPHRCGGRGPMLGRRIAGGRSSDRAVSHTGRRRAREWTVAGGAGRRTGDDSGVDRA
jgi:hypothetical protein